MPTLPTGLRLGISRDAIFDPGENWFSCPDNHFWYWTPDPEAGVGPFASGEEIIQIPTHAIVPSTTQEAQHYVRVIVFESETSFYWPGEWLSSFPKSIALDERDLAAWQTWLASDQTIKFLKDTIYKCQKFAVNGRGAQGYAVFSSTDERQGSKLGDQ